MRPVASAVLLTNWWTMKWYCHDSRWPMRSTVWLMVSLMARAVIGGTSATASAIVCASAASSARGTTRFTRPIRSAAVASSVVAQSRNSLARRGPSSHGSISSSTPTPLMRATGLEKRASSAATMRSHIAASISPAALHTPCTAAIVIFGQSRIRTSLSQYMTCSCASLPSGVARIAAQCSSPARISLRSWPAEKCLPSAAEHDHPHGVVGLGAVERGVELGDQLRALRVRGVGSVERDRRDRARRPRTESSAPRHTPEPANLAPAVRAARHGDDGAPAPVVRGDTLR